MSSPAPPFTLSAPLFGVNHSALAVPISVSAKSPNMLTPRMLMSVSMPPRPSFAVPAARLMDSPAVWSE